MFFVVESAEVLGKAAASASSACGSSDDTNPMQAVLMLHAEADRVDVYAVDVLSHELKLTIPAKVNLPGKVLIAPGHFSKIVTKLGKNKTTVRLDGNELLVTPLAEDTHRFWLYQGEAADFPLTLGIPPIVGQVDAKALLDELKSILGVAMNSEQEITFFGHEGTMHLITSEFVTARARFKMLDQSMTFLFGVHKSALAGKLPTHWSGPVNIHVSDDTVMFSREGEHLLIKGILHDTDVNQYDTLLSMPPMCRMVVSSSLFRNKVGTIAYDKQIVCNLNVIGRTDKNLVVSADNVGSSASRMMVAIQGAVVGTPAPVALDALLLDKALKAIDGDDFQIDLIDFNGDGTEIFVRIANDANPEKRQALVVPLQGT